MRLTNPLTVVLAAGLLSGIANAQLLPPPPPAGDPEPAYAPPPRPAARPAPAAQPQANPRPQPQPQANNARRVRDIPNFPYAPLACPIASIPGCDGYDGPPAIYDRAMHIMALTRNPTTTNGIVPGIRSVIVKRRIEQLEPAIIEHLDTMLEIREGFIETITIGDLAGLQQTTQRLQPLTAQPPLTTALVEGGFITRVMSEWNIRVMREYQRALGEWWQENEPDRASDLLLQHVMKDSVAEANEAFEALLIEVALRPDAIIERVELPTNVSQSLLGLRTDIDALDTEALRRDAAQRVGLALRTINTDSYREILRAAIDTRAEENTALVNPIPVEYEGKRITESAPVQRFDPAQGLPARRGQTNDNP